MNEDSYALAPEIGLYLVADGMGGHTAGQVASQLAAKRAVDAVMELGPREVTPLECLRNAVSVANQSIYDHAQENPEFAGMGTTLVAILTARGRVSLAHVGDSRAYLVRQGKIRQLTDDHSVVGELLRRREISEEAAREHPHRHVLTRALGVRQLVEPDLAELTPAVGDVFVLCSDGLTGHVEDDEIAKTVTGDTDLDMACESLIRLANQRGGKDNVTVVLVRCEDVPSTE